MSKPKPPSAKSIARQLSALHRAISIVYGADGRHEVTRTTERGTLVVSWRSGWEVKKDALRGEGEENAET